MKGFPEAVVIEQVASSGGLKGGAEGVSRDYAERWLDKTML